MLLFFFRSRHNTIVRWTGVMDFRKFRCLSARARRACGAKISVADVRRTRRFRLAGSASRFRGGSEIRDEPTDTDVIEFLRKSAHFSPVRQMLSDPFGRKAHGNLSDRPGDETITVVVDGFFHPSRIRRRKVYSPERFVV